VPRFELTDAQGYPLCELVHIQRATGTEARFLDYGRVLQMKVGLKSENIEISGFNRHLRELWGHSGFIFLEHHETYASFYLMKRALDYADYMRKPKLVRNIQDWVDKWTSEIRAGVIALIVSLLVNYFPLLVKWLVALFE